MINRSIQLFILQLITISIWSQSPAHKIYDAESEYGGTTSWTIDKDSRGIIWSSPSGTGIVGFDGKTFFKLSEKDGLAGNMAISFGEDSLGNFWIGCQGQGVSVYDGKNFTNYSTQDSIGLRSNNILSLHCHSNGEMYLGTYQAGLLHFIDGQFETIGDSTSTIYDILEDDQGVLWLATAQQGLARFDGKEIIYTDSEKGLTNKIIQQIVFDASQNILTPTGDGLFQYNQDGTIKRYGVDEGFPKNYSASHCVILDNGDFVLAMNNNLMLYSNNTLVNLTQHSDFSSDITGLVQDQNKNIWIATNGSGLIQLMFNGISLVKSEGENGVTAVCEGLDGRINFANSSGIYQLIAGKSELVFEFESPLKGIQNLYQKDSLNWYVSGKLGIIHIDKAAKSTTTFYNRTLFAMSKENDSALIFGGLGGLMHFNLNSHSITFYEPFGEIIPYTSTVVGDQNELYFGAYSDGSIIRISNNDTIKFDESNGLPTDAKIDLEIDSKGRLWYLTINGGFGVLKNGNFESFKIPSASSFDDLIIDENDDLWISGLSGIRFIHLEDDVIKSTRFFGRNTGIPEGIPQSGQAIITGDGSIFVPKGIAGLYRIDPKSIEKNNEKPQIYIADLLGKDYTEIDTQWFTGYSKLYGIPENLVLDYNFNDLSLFLGTVYFSDPDSVLYSYKLSNKDAWSQPQRSAMISFTNMPAGVYRLQLKAIAPSGESDVLIYNFTIKTPWYQSWWFYALIFIAAILLVFLFIKWRLSKLQKDKIELEKIIKHRTKEVFDEKDKVTKAYQILALKNNEILDSIVYAKRIQNAILPPKKLVKEFLPNSFVLYKPKDVVAGDFYWMERSANGVLFAAADCTGHGVPGAMVSVICNNALNRAVREFDLTDPGLILDKAREIVIQEFEKSEEDVKDGMDIALCKIESDKIVFAGANNPLIIIRNGEIIETKGNKQPIGKFHKEEPFTSHELKLEIGDQIYVFTDGFADQFGGEFGKKLKTANFKKLLIQNSNYSMDDQLEKLDAAFESWKGEYDQLDDVCVIGVQF